MAADSTMSARDFLTLPGCAGVARFRLGDYARYNDADFKVGQRRAKKILGCCACSCWIKQGDVFGYTSISAIDIYRGTSPNDRLYLCPNCLDHNPKVGRAD